MKSLDLSDFFSYEYLFHNITMLSRVLLPASIGYKRFGVVPSNPKYLVPFVFILGTHCIIKIL